MKDLKEFAEKLVKIEFLDHCNAFGFGTGWEGAGL